jgi:pilus assembly protein Flp/PilA
MGHSWVTLFKRLVRDDDGPAAVEYAVMIALILIGIITAVTSFGVGTGGMFSTVRSEMDAHL